MLSAIVLPSSQHFLLPPQARPKPVRLLTAPIWPRAEPAQGRLAAALLLRLLVTWCDCCSPAVGALLATPSHLPLVVDMVAGR